MGEGPQGQATPETKGLTALGALAILAVVVLVASVGYEYMTLLWAAVSWTADRLGARGEWSTGGTIAAYLFLVPTLPLAAMWAWAAVFEPWRDRRIRAALQERIHRRDPTVAEEAASRLDEAIEDGSAEHARQVLALLDEALAGAHAEEARRLRAAFDEYAGAAAHGDGAFHADGWSQVVRDEKRAAARGRLAELRRRLGEGRTPPSSP